MGKSILSHFSDDRQPHVIYQPAGTSIEIDLPADFEHRTVWATQRQIADTLDLDVSVVNRHIQNFKEQRGEHANLSIANFAILTQDGKRAMSSITT